VKINEENWINEKSVCWGRFTHVYQQKQILTGEEYMLMLH
jgi:hypothetical protein